MYPMGLLCFLAVLGSGMLMGGLVIVAMRAYEGTKP